MGKAWDGRHERVPKRGHTKPGIRARITEAIKRTAEGAVG